MSRPKAFLKAEKAKKKHAKSEGPQDADDILADGVEFEEAGEKWRGGDAAKSMRFFLRAQETYSTGLQKFPQSLDLAYNKARVQYEIATHPILVKQLQVPLLSALNDALLSHQYALQLDRDNPDTLFNTGQVLTSIAEEIAKDSQRSEAEAVQLLEQALELFQRCLDVQEARYEENQRQIEIAMAASNDDAPAAASTENEEESEDTTIQATGSTKAAAKEQWASIVEPITKNSLLDTALAQISALTTLLGLLSQQDTSILSTIEDIVTKLLTKKIPVFVEGGERTSEVALAKANLLSALLEANFRSSNIDLQTYKHQLTAAYSDPSFSPSTSPETSLASANALISFNSAIADTILPSHPEFTITLAIRWQSLSSATETLTKAAKISGIVPEDLAQTHYLRGDIALLQHQMGQTPSSFATAANNAAILLKNAVTFYRNATKLAAAAHDEKMRQEASVKGLVAQVQQAGGDVRSAVKAFGTETVVQGVDREAFRDVLSEMADEGLAGPDFVEEIWRALH